MLPSSGYAKGAGIEWDILNDEVARLYGAGTYDRATVVAKEALEVARENVGPDHPDVATSLNRLAELYRAQGHYAKAESRTIALDQPDGGFDFSPAEEDGIISSAPKTSRLPTRGCAIDDRYTYPGVLGGTISYDPESGTLVTEVSTASVALNIKTESPWLERTMRFSSIDMIHDRAPGPVKTSGDQTPVKKTIEADVNLLKPVIDRKQALEDQSQD